jgi:hypothetical protein
MQHLGVEDCPMISSAATKWGSLDEDERAALNYAFYDAIMRVEKVAEHRFYLLRLRRVTALRSVLPRPRPYRPSIVKAYMLFGKRPCSDDTQMPKVRSPLPARFSKRSASGYSMTFTSRTPIRRICRNYIR